MSTTFESTYRDQDNALHVRFVKTEYAVWSLCLLPNLSWACYPDKPYSDEQGLAAVLGNTQGAALALVVGFDGPLEPYEPPTPTRDDTPDSTPPSTPPDRGVVDWS